jgi:hypothetical protein
MNEFAWVDGDLRAPAELRFLDQCCRSHVLLLDHSTGTLLEHALCGIMPGPGRVWAGMADPVERQYLAGLPVCRLCTKNSAGWGIDVPALVEQFRLVVTKGI